MTDYRAHVTLDGLVGTMFAQSNLGKFTSDPLTLQQFFFRMREREDLSEPVSTVLGRLRFEVGDVFPFSRELEASLMRLQIGGLLSAMNPDYDKFSMDDEQRQLALERFNRYNSPEQESIVKLAAEFVNAGE